VTLKSRIWYTYPHVVYRVNLICSSIANLTASSTSFASKVGVFDWGNDDRCRGSYTPVWTRIEFHRARLAPAMSDVTDSSELG